MKLDDILIEDCVDCEQYEEVYVDETDNVYDSDMNHLGTVDQVENETIAEDWGSSDWTAALRAFKQELEAGVSIDDAAYSVASFYNDGNEYDGWEKFSPERLVQMAEIRGIIDEQGQILEASQRQWKRVGTRMIRKFRCSTGPKAGKLVSDPSKCAGRKDPTRVKIGRRVMRSKKNTIARKAKISKRKQISKMVTRMNQRLMGKNQKSTSPAASKKRTSPAPGPGMTSTTGTTRSPKGTVSTKKPT